MNGSIIIDGINATQTWGIFIREGGYESLVALPPIKEPQVIDWPEEDGVQVDLSEIRFKNREITLRFGTMKQNSDLSAFFILLTDGAFHSFEFPELGITREMRMISCPEYKSGILKLSAFSIRLSEDDPMSGYTYQEPTGGRFPTQGLLIDNKDISEYGLALLEGSEAEIMRTPEVKQNLTINTNKINGIQYDPDQVKMKSKELTIKMLLIAVDAQQFNRNLNAFYFDLTRPGERVMQYSPTRDEYKFYYKATEIKRMQINQRYWCEINLRICFTSQVIKRNLYLFFVDGWLKAGDNPYQSEKQMLHAAIDREMEIEDAIELLQNYNTESGEIKIEITSNEAEIEVAGNDGKLLITQ